MTDKHPVRFEPVGIEIEVEDVEHDSYSTFALPDSEKDEGFTLLCRAHVYEDVTVAPLNYDGRC